MMCRFATGRGRASQARTIGSSGCFRSARLSSSSSGSGSPSGPPAGGSSSRRKSAAASSRTSGFRWPWGLRCDAVRCSTPQSDLGAPAQVRAGSPPASPQFNSIRDIPPQHIAHEHPGRPNAISENVQREPWWSWSPTLGGQQLLCQVQALPCRHRRQQPDSRRADTRLIIVHSELSQSLFNLGLSFQSRPECVQRILGEIPWTRRGPRYELGKCGANLFACSLCAQKPESRAVNQSGPRVSPQEISVFAVQPPPGPASGMPIRPVHLPATADHRWPL